MRIELIGLPSEVEVALTALQASQLAVVSVAGPFAQRSGPLVSVDVETRMPAGPSGWMAVPTGHVPNRSDEIRRALVDYTPEPENLGASGRRPRRVGGGGRA